MRTVKTIKDVDDEAWSDFKSMAAKDKVKMGKLFERMVENYKASSESFWDKILNGPKLLSDEEADEMLKMVKKLREESRYRKIQ